MGKLRADSRGMTRDPDKIKNYDLALLDKLPETSTDALGNDVRLHSKRRKYGKNIFQGYRSKMLFQALKALI